MVVAILALAIAVLLSAFILNGAITTMVTKNQAAAARIDVSASAIVNVVDQLLAKFEAHSAELREIAANAKATTGDDAAIQLNATADRLDQEVAAIAGALAKDAGGETGGDPATVTVVVSDQALPAAKVGDSYTASLSASGGQGPYTFATADTLPVWLSLSPNGGLSGTPDVDGNVSFNVTAADANAVTGSGPVSISVSPAG